MCVTAYTSRENRNTWGTSFKTFNAVSSIEDKSLYIKRLSNFLGSRRVYVNCGDIGHGNSNECLQWGSTRLRFCELRGYLKVWGFLFPTKLQQSFLMQATLKFEGTSIAWVKFSFHLSDCNGGKVRLKGCCLRCGLYVTDSLLLLICWNGCRFGQR